MSGPVNKNGYATLFDANLCVGCESCLEACKEANKLPKSEVEGLCATTYTTLEDHDDVYLRRMCMHCLEPSCASVCPVGAMHKTPEGPVVYEYEKCMGCRYCMVACPFQIPRYEWDTMLPRVRKCEMCYERTSKGQPTACSEACPAEATMFGHRSEMIALAWKRISEDPDNYAQKVYGLEEVGGTGVLIIGPPALMESAFDPRVPMESLPQKTWVVLSKIPATVAVVGAGLLGVNWVIQRRMKLAADAVDVTAEAMDAVESRRRSKGDAA